MKEKIEDIAKSIKKHRELKLKDGVSNPAVGRSQAYYLNKSYTFWLLNNENITGYNNMTILETLLRE